MATTEVDPNPDDVVTLTGQQLNWLLNGYDVMRMQPHERLHFSSVLYGLFHVHPV